jgi:predicted branched-subunit amino acid permease
VLLLEIETENKRAERLAAQEAEATLKRHNWQYMGIIIAIFSLFSVLAVLGVFNVSIKWVRAIGFISFIFLFEFIILLADTWIHHTTHGEPWKVLAIKVVLIAILMPLHHWLEHKAIHFILERRNTSNALVSK